MTKILRELKHLVILPVCALLFFIGAVTVQATTYYVATTGSDSNSGTSGSPFLTIQRCIDTVEGGDTCTVADGTYTDTDGNGIVGYITGANGTAGAPITIKSTNPFGAIIKVPGINSHNAGFYVARTYYIIEGFNISGGTSNDASASHHGVSVAGGATGSIVRKNTIHNIASTICSNSIFGNTGVFLDDATGITIEGNSFYTIGRLRNGEKGCSTILYQNDHGIYVKGTTNTTILRNVFRDTNRGWPIHLYGGTATNISIYNNTLVGKSPTGSPVGQIMLASTITTANIKNNISYDAEVAMIHYYSLTASGVTVSYNLSNTLEKTSTRAGVAFSNNLERTGPGFVDVLGNNFKLTTGSAAIDAGTNVGYQFNGAAPDIGAHEFLDQGGDSSAPASPQSLRVN